MLEGWSGTLLFALVVVGPAQGLLLGVGIEQQPEGWGWLGADRVVGVEVDVGEERLVGHPADSRRAAGVDDLPVPGQRQALV
ncbi:hypothetical protein [Rudaeicoccus suwonensis]|uniref:hypothetical protein n=1 Tax=Rudaeicoccus suwonensis TaxID=657409 RepID=UPI00119DEB61|nr:hypothetical protein [Rudaeicoccus suwonensis]